MATTTNYGWTTPDDTGLVKDGASAIRSLGTSVDTTTKNLNPSTTLGDIEYRSSTANTNTRLGIGSTGQILTVAGGVPSWAAPAGGGANWSLLNAGGTALTGATTITVSGISGVDKVMVLVNNASAANSGSIITLRANADSGSNYYNFGTQLEIASTYNTDIASIVGSNGDATTAFRFATMGSNAASQFAGYVSLTGCNSSGVKMFQTVGAANNGGGNNFVHRIVGGYYNSSSTISSISIISSSGNFDAGTIFVYTSA